MKNKQQNKKSGRNGANRPLQKKRGKSRAPTGLRLQKTAEKLVGVIEGNAKGYGFLVCKEREDDAFIAREKMNGAIHGDTVEAVLIGYKKNGGEAEVVKILSRRYPNVIGTYFAENNYGVCIPDDIRIAKEIFIPRGACGGAAHLDKVVVDADWKNADKHRAPSGTVIEVLGPIEKKGVDILSIVRSYNLHERFPAQVLKAANAAAAPVSQAEQAGRRDFTNDLIFTIDGDDSKDFDDAVGLTKNEQGNYVLGVHIADVAHYVPRSSVLDQEAFKRGTSVYFPDRVLPMLPEQLSNDICSLNADVKRLTLSVLMEIDGAGTVVRHEICEGVIKSAARMTYSVVAKILDSDRDLRARYEFLIPTLERMERLSGILFAKRKDRGNIDFDLDESEIVLDDAGKTIDVRRKPRLISHRMIEEFMLAANETVAKAMCAVSAPFVYRVHENPPAEKVAALTDFLSALGIEFPGDAENPQPRDFAALLSSVAGGAYETAVGRMTLRSMSKACYQPVNKGHFGLAAPYYCHFTSPIRRYPDLAIHRIIKDYLASGKACFTKYAAFVSDAAVNASETERTAEKAERDADALKKAEYMQDKIGMQFAGVISGVTEWGIFAELDNTVEGMVRSENLPGDRYTYNPRQMILSNAAASYRIGDPIAVEVLAVNGMRTEFKLVEEKKNK